MAQLHLVYLVTSWPHLKSPSALLLLVTSEHDCFSDLSRLAGQVCYLQSGLPVVGSCSLPCGRFLLQLYTGVTNQIKTNMIHRGGMIHKDLRPRDWDVRAVQSYEAIRFQSKTHLSHHQVESREVSQLAGGWAQRSRNCSSLVSPHEIIRD